MGYAQVLLDVGDPCRAVKRSGRNGPLPIRGEVPEVPQDKGRNKGGEDKHRTDVVAAVIRRSIAASPDASVEGRSEPSPKTAREDSQRVDEEECREQRTQKRNHQRSRQ